MVFVLKCPCLNCTLHLSAAPTAPESNEEVEWIKGNFKGKKIGAASLALAGVVLEEEKLFQTYTLSKDWKMWKIHHCSNCRVDLYSHQTSNPSLLFVNVEELKTEEEFLKLQASPKFSKVFRIILDGEVGKDISIETPAATETEKLATFSRLQKKLEGVIRTEADAMDKRIKEYEEEQKKQFQKFQISLLGQRKLLWQKLQDASQPVRNPISSSSSASSVTSLVLPAHTDQQASANRIAAQKPRSPASPRNSYRLSSTISNPTPANNLTNNSLNISTNSTNTSSTSTNTPTSGATPPLAQATIVASASGVRSSDSTTNLPVIEISSTSVKGTNTVLTTSFERRNTTTPAATVPADKKLTYDEPAIFSFEEESGQKDTVNDLVPDDKDEEMKESTEERGERYPSRKHSANIYSSSVPISIPLNKFPVLDESLARTLKPHELASTLYTPNPYNSMFDVPLSSTKRIKSII